MLKGIESITNNEETKTPRIPYNLQFFAADNADDGKDDADDEKKESDSNADGDSDASKKDETEKKFTQADLNRIATKESKSAQSKLAKELGFANFADLKKAMEGFNAYQESQKTDAEKQQAQVKLALEQVEQSRAEKSDAENRLACFMAGVNKDSIDDIMAIAQLKVSDDKSLAVVLEEMRKSDKYTAFFSSEAETGKKKGTGSDMNNLKGQKDSKDSKDGIGARLAHKYVPKDGAELKPKSNFFRN